MANRLARGRYPFLTAVKRYTRIDTSDDSVHLSLMDEELFDYPWLWSQQPGRWGLSGDRIKARMPFKPPRWRGIRDSEGRVIVAINFIMDMADAWEHADDPFYPVPMTSFAYRVGINYLTYSLTH